MSFPEDFDGLTARAEAFVRAYFSGLRADPAQARISVGDERYVQVRAASLSVEFFDLIKRVYGGDREPQAENVARSLLFDLAHAIALADAREFQEKVDVVDPRERLALGPLHFAYSGWAVVKMIEGSYPTPDEDYFLVYDHLHSFEAEAWLRQGRTPSAPVCLMSAGYSSGWCEASFGIPLVATEILCEARGDPHCRFVMAPPHRIRERLAEWLQSQPDVGVRLDDVAIPGFFAERRRAERALHESEARFHQAFSHARHGMAIVAIDGRLLKVNAAWADLFDATPSDLEGSGLDLLDTPEDRKRAAVAIMNALEEGTPSATFEAVARTRSGNRLEIEVSTSIVRDEIDAPLYFVVQLKDLTAERRALAELRERDRQLQRAQRLAAAEALAGGLAHDFNNLLTVILAASEQLQGDLKDRPEGRTAATIFDAAQRASAVTQQLLAFSRGQVVERRTLEMGPLVQGLGDLMARVLGERIAFGIEVDPDAGAVRADAGQLEQVLVNLAVNARNAMPGGGRLIVRVLAVPDAPWEDGGVALEVQDTGVGMSAPVLERAFEPFFTTRAEGTGLGLAVVRGIIEQSGGQVEIRSTPGSGTTVRILLPAVTATPTPTPSRDLGPSVEGRETILVVEDDAAIRELLTEGLEGLGYTVFAAASGEEAIERVAAGVTADLVISDVVMPGLGGPAAVRSILQALPHVRVLFVTGYADRELEPHRMPAGVPILRKPFTLTALAARVRELLGGGG